MANINDIKNLLQAKAAGIKQPAPVVRTEPMVTPPLKKAKQEGADYKVQKITKDERSSREKDVASTDPISKIIADYLIADMDYGVIPGCRKPSLYKSGAEKLCAYFAYKTRLDIISRTEMYEKSFVAYEVKVSILDSNGSIQAEGIGACNSRERKFLKGDFFTAINTVLKMAKKRAYVDAILTATHASGIFTQDMEDIAVSTMPAKIV